MGCERGYTQLYRAHFTVYALGEQNNYSVLFTNVKHFEHVYVKALLTTALYCRLPLFVSV